MTKFYQDILKEPTELLRSLDYTLRDGRSSLEEAARILKQSEHIYIVGIGSSWNAGLAVLSFFNAAGRPAMLCDASEILHFGALPKNAAIVFLSRSGKSTEIVQLLGLKSFNCLARCPPAIQKLLRSPIPRTVPSPCRRTSCSR